MTGTCATCAYYVNGMVTAENQAMADLRIPYQLEGIAKRTAGKDAGIGGLG